MKWRILLNLPSYPIAKQSKIITAMMALHNFIRESAIHDEDFENYVQDDSSGASQGSMDDATFK
uniref:DDE Tnp4 domain-containing protein n=1 Tax=Arundo donax TaxID=35708 RepID=A0A0A8ZBM7_ARUDO